MTVPDVYGFDHLVSSGATSHRCVECGWPSEVTRVDERARARHAEQHVRERRRDIERRRLDNLREARRLQRQAERENALVDERTKGAR